MNKKVLILSLFISVLPVVLILVYFFYVDGYKQKRHIEAIGNAELIGADFVSSRTDEDGGRITFIKFDSDWQGDNNDLSLLENLSGEVQINIHGEKFNNIGFSYLAKIKGLTLIWADGASINDDALLSLKESKIKSVGLYGTDITDKGLLYLSRVKSIEDIDLRDTHITDDGVRYLADLPNLKSVRFWGTKVTNKGIMHLVGSRNLQEINYYDSGITKAGVCKLKEKLPNIKEDCP